MTKMYNKNMRNNKKQKKYEDDLWFGILIFIGFLCWGVWFYNDYTSYIPSNSAIIEGRLMSVSPRVSGIVAHLYVEDGQEVKKGDLIAELNSDFYETELNKAFYNLRASRSKENDSENPQQDNNPVNKIMGNNLFKEPPAKLNQIISRKVHFNQDDYDSNARMYNEEITAIQNREKSKNVLLGSGENNENPQTQNGQNGQVKVVENAETVTDEKQLTANIEQAKLNLSNTKIFAPQDGVISAIQIKEGDWVEVAQTILSVIPKRVWVTANFDAQQADNIIAGQPVIVKIPSYRGRKFKGVVESIQFKKDQPQTPSNRKTVPVRIIFTEDYSAFDIKPGTVVSARVKYK